MTNKRVLKSIAQGAGITFIAFICTYILAFFYRILVARSLGPNDYGTLMLAVAVLGFGRSISLIGLHSGVKRYIGFYLGTKEAARVKGTIISSLKLVMPFSIIISGILFISAEWIALNIFHSHALVPILRIFTLIIP